MISMPLEGILEAKARRQLLLGCFAVIVACWFASPVASASRNPCALVLVNSRATNYPDFSEYVEPYLVQFGLPYQVRDIAKVHAYGDLGDYALLIIGHRGLDVPHQFLTIEDEQQILKAVDSGTGLLSFDGLVAAWSKIENKQVKDSQPLYSFVQEIFGFNFAPPEATTTLTIGASQVTPSPVALDHYITNLEPSPREVELKQPMMILGTVPGPQAQVLAWAGKQPLLVAASHGRGRAVVWTSYQWVKPEFKGQLYGLDDLVWRGAVWAARKPFVLRGMPHYLALRIDDVAGFGQGSNRHLGYVQTVNRYGLKPWLGVFIDDMREDPEATEALARYTQQGLATASIHARRYRSFFYYDEPLLRDEVKINIAGRDWPSEKVAANFAQGEAFFAEHKIVKSKFVIPHYYEFGTNDFEGLKRWGAEFTCTIIEPGRGLGDPLLKAGPYLTSPSPRTSHVQDPLYIADWFHTPIDAEGKPWLFNFVEEIRDVAGYEWAPSGVPVEEAIRRGVVESRREFDSLLPALLFTHESDHIQHIQPEAWDQIVKGVIDNLKPYQPVSVTVDFLAQYLRAVHTSKIQAVGYDEEKHQGSVEFVGHSDVPIKFTVFESDSSGPTAQEWQAPPFHGRVVVQWRTRGQD